MQRNIGVWLVIFIVFAWSRSASADIVYQEEFTNNSAGWTLGNEWMIGSATASSGQAFGNPDPSQDHSISADNGVAGVKIGGNATISVHPFVYLVSPVYDLAAYPDVTFSYFRWLNSDHTPFMQNTVDVFNGSAWNNLWTSGGFPGLEENAWTYQEFDVTAHKSNQMQVRFGFNIGSSGVFAVSSWNVDDVQFSTSVPEPGSAFVAIGFLACLMVTRRRNRARS